MKRILVMLGSLLVAYVLLTCALPVEGFLDDQGDEVRLTDNALVEYDPVFYDTPSYDGDIENARIAYHDGQAVRLYDYPSDTDEIIYTAPEGYTITALTSSKVEASRQGLLIALEGNGEAVIIQEDDLEFTEIYREGGERIDNISCCLDGPDGYYVLLERNGDIYYFGADNTPLGTTHGTCPTFEDWCIFLYLKNIDGVDCIYRYELYGGGIIDELFFSDGSDINELSSSLIVTSKRFSYTYVTCNRNGVFDIFVYHNNDLSRVTDMLGIERDICAWNDYVVFVRTVDGQSDIYIVRGGYDYN